MSPSVFASAAIALAVLLASGAAGRPSDEWTPSRSSASQSRAFGASRRSFSVAAAPVNAVKSRSSPAKQVAVEEEAAVDNTPAEARGAGASLNEVGDDDGWMSWLPASAEMRVLGKVWDDCSEREDMSGCLKGKALTFLERASRKESLSLPGGLQMVRTARADSAAAPLTEASLEAELPRDLSQRETRLDQMLLERLVGFLQTHALRFNLADDEDSAAGSERGIKKKDLLPYLLLGKLVASSMVAMAFTGLALLAGKALMVSKVALLLSGIVALKKLFNGHSSGGGGVEVVNVPASGGHYGRSLDVNEDAHNLAFRGQMQRPVIKA